uniref:JUNLI-1 n=1 Tax=Schmidtea mediterranea TaxID=79327 RepID=H9CXV2_SCHMD|nr:JUNLI-1 [Schmidtea mediterranea]
MTQFLMQHNIKKEKSEFGILAANLGSKKYISNKGSNALRPDSLEIKIKPDNIVNIISKSELCSDNVNSWTGDHLDNFISQLKNANNTPSPITPNSFFNPSDVTQEQEQFADTLTLHLNKIKENYQSGCQPTGPSYLGNIIQLSSANDDRPLSIATVSVGNKVFLLNQINQNIDDNANQCLNYGVLDLPGNITIHGDVNNINPNTIILQKNAPNIQPQIKVANIHNFSNQATVTNSQNIICSTPNVQFNAYSHRNENNELTHLMPIDTDVGLPQTDINQQDLIQSMGFIKTSEGIIYTRIPDSSHTELLSQLNSLTNSTARSNPNGQNSHPPIKAPSMELMNQSINETRCLSASSNGNESSFGANDSSVNNSHKDYSSNGTKINKLLDKDLDVDQQRRLERKRARNRDAARKCRDRKNNLILNLEQKYAKQTVEKELIRDKLLKSLEEIRRLTDYIAKHDPHSKFACFSNFLNDIKIHELTDTDLKDLNLI